MVTSAAIMQNQNINRTALTETSPVPATVEHRRRSHALSSELSGPHPEMLTVEDMTEQKINVYLSRTMSNAFFIPNAGVVVTQRSLCWLSGALIAGCL